ncbi:hypothetical protein N431DRAFT_16519 [Stipitochalara longipes BDJ]|nr:hypothetical protein N431DRAFT_16519 [Stipitochalara longipes BDJ]
MAEPVTILAIVNGSVGLAIKIGTVANKLYTLSRRLKYAELTLQSLASECEMMQAAWVGIQAWVRQQRTHLEEEQQALLDRIKKSLLFGTIVLTALEGDLDQFLNEPQGSGLLRRNKIVWNEASFERHQNRIRGQVAAMTLLLQVIKLPSTAEQADLLAREDGVLRNSDETAWTIVDSSASYSIRHPHSRLSIDSTETVYVRFDFEPELLSSRTYGRRYKYLAKQLARRGKEVLQVARADLFIRERGGKGDEDGVSVLSVSRHGDSYSGFQDNLNLASNVRRFDRKVVPGLPRAPIFKRQQSELRDRLEPVNLAPMERRAISVDRRRRIVQSENMIPNSEDEQIRGRSLTRRGRSEIVIREPTPFLIHKESLRRRSWSSTYISHRSLSI